MNCDAILANSRRVTSAWHLQQAKRLLDFDAGRHLDTVLVYAAVELRAAIERYLACNLLLAPGCVYRPIVGTSLKLFGVAQGIFLLRLVVARIRIRIRARVDCLVIPDLDITMVDRHLDQPEIQDPMGRGNMRGSNQLLHRTP